MGNTLALLRSRLIRPDVHPTIDLPESAVSTSVSNAFATSTATRLFPTAVGPISTRTGLQRTCVSDRRHIALAGMAIMTIQPARTAWPAHRSKDETPCGVHAGRS